MIETKPSLRGTDDCIRCHIKRIQADEIEATYTCIADGDGYRVPLDLELPEDLLVEHSDAIETGTAEFCVPRAYQRDAKKLVVPPKSGLEPLSARHLQDSQTHTELLSGTKRLLAVRLVTTAGEEPEESASEIQAALFGTGPFLYTPEASVVHQYAAISHSQFHLVPAEGDLIEGGVVEVVLDQRVEGSRVQVDLVSAILEATQETLGPLDLVADRFVFCLPNNSLLQDKDTWTAFTYLFEPYSYYQQSRCTKLSVVMHELGHSFGFRHSGSTGNDYADETGYMGYAVNKFGLPMKAFNAHKHWLAGWFDDRKLTVDPTAGASAPRLASFVDYGTAGLVDEDMILVRAGNLYIQYNRAKSYNSDTPLSFANHVIVTESPDVLEVSQLVASLAMGESFMYTGYGSHALVIEVCEQSRDSATGIDFANISIHLNDGIQASLCRASHTFVNATLPNSTISETVFDDDLLQLNTTGDFEDGRPEYSEGKVDTNSIVVGVVWCIVGVLLVIAFYLAYKVRVAAKRKASRLETENRRRTRLQRSQDLPSSITIEQKKSESMETEESFTSSDTDE